jgi:hypothetical protein
MAGKTKIGKALETDAAKEGEYTNYPSAQAFAAKAKDLDALREAVVDAAGVGAGLWLSYLFLFFYLFIAVAAVTHRDFLFENPVKLPFLDVELPLLGFFVLGPLLFLVLHAYVLLHFAMLAGKVIAAGIRPVRAEKRIRIRERTPGCSIRRTPSSSSLARFSLVSAFAPSHVSFRSAFTRKAP